MFVLFLFMLLLSPSKLEGLEFVIYAALVVLGSSLWLLGSAVSFYAFFRAIGQIRANASGSETPPSD